MADFDIPSPALRELAHLVEFAEAYAWEDHFAAAPDEIKELYRMHIDRLGSGVVLSMFDYDDSFYNRLVGLGINEPVFEHQIDELMDYIYGTGTSTFAVHLSPAVNPPEVEDWLIHRGFLLSDRHAKFIRDASAPNTSNTDLRVEWTTPEFSEAYAYVTTLAFGLPEFMYPWMRFQVGRPGWSHYIAWDGEEPVAAGALYVNDHVGWLGHGCTLPTHRRRGAQGAILENRLLDGIAQGCNWFVSDTFEDTPDQPNTSYRNMFRNGFKLAYLRSNYILNTFRP